VNQSITGDIAAMMAEVRRSGLLASVCTITVPPGEFDAGGAPDPEAACVDLVGHTDIPCIDAPMGSLSGPNEKKTLEEIAASDFRDVLLDGYYPEIEEHYRAVIDDTWTYDIVGVDWDSQRTQTNLSLKRVKL